jgi:hypothetical protein
VCWIKHRVVDEDERRRMPATDKVQYLGTPLVLGSCDGFNAHHDLRESPVFDVIDVGTDATRTVGPGSDSPTAPP